MATDKSNTGFRATLGQVGPNKGGSHGSVPIASEHVADNVPAQGSSGAPGTELPWNGPDSTDIGSTTALPALTHLGGSKGGHDVAEAH
jgi:hypothetical protein